jgi:AcrR family transcriptional regulator
MKAGTKIRERLTRDRVIEAALHVMDAEGLEAVSMRRVAREVGVEAMSLYNHVRDKDDILEGLCIRVMSEFEFPERHQDWPEAARFAANEWRRVLKQHPNVITLFAGHAEPMTHVEGLRPMEFALGLLREAGLSDRDAARVFNVMGSYIMGFVLMEVGQMFGAGALDKRAPDPMELGRLMPMEELPHIAAALPHLAACDPDDVFNLGFDMLIAGQAALFDDAAGGA